jgi:hypothetical protein
MTTTKLVPNGAAAISTATAPTLGNINTYNASGGALAVTLPALSGCNVGASAWLEKSILDTTYNTVTFTANGSDTFDDGSTSLVLATPLEKRDLQVVSISGTKYWKAGYGYIPKPGLAANASVFTLSNTTTASTIITTTLPSASLAAGSMFQITINGAVQTAATSGVLLFTPYIQGTALAQTASMASTTSANAASAFQLQYNIAVRTTGSTGTAIAQPWGQINLATTGVVYLANTGGTANTINTTSSASSTALYVTAQWATASASNILTVQTAAIERLV